MTVSAWHLTGETTSEEMLLAVKKMTDVELADAKMQAIHLKSQLEWTDPNHWLVKKYAELFTAATAEQMARRYAEVNRTWDAVHGAIPWSEKEAAE